MANELPESASAMLQRKIKIDSDLADRLVAGGMETLEEVAYFPWDEYFKICQLPQKEAWDLRYIAKAYLMNEALDDEAF
jgi:hypothetical protein